MLIALIIFNIIHPGKIMAGKENDFPSRKERKNMVQSRGTELSSGLAEP